MYTDRERRGIDRRDIRKEREVKESEGESAREEGRNKRY